MSSPPLSPPEGCDNSSGDLPKVRLNATALSDPGSLTIPVSVLFDPSDPPAELPTTGLVDCGSTHCFIDSKFVSTHDLTTYTMPPRRLHLLDGSSNSVINRAVDLPIRFPTGDIFTSTFFVTPLDSSAALVFGYNWLHRYNPLIDWSANRIDYFRTPPQTTPTSKPPSGPTAPIQPPENTCTLPTSPSDPPVDPTPSAFPSISISFVNAVAFNRACKLPGSEVFQLSPSDINGISGRASATSAAKPPIDLSHVPEEYHEFRDVFSQDKADSLPPHRPYDLKIDLEVGAEPPLGRMYSLSQSETQSLREFLDENLRIGFIRPSTSAHGAPILFVKKKDGSLRLCVDYRGLKKISKKDRYPLPLISDLLDAPGKARIYSKIDLRHAYHLVRIADGDEPKTTFRTRYGSFEWLVMPFGLSNAPTAFQRFMNDTFSDMIDVSVVVYLDDILIYSPDPASHRKHVKEVLRRLRKAGLYARADKCEFHSERVEYLGYILSPKGLFMAEDKIQTIRDWPEPRKVKDVQSFLGFANFYRRFIYHYSDIVVPLTQLTRKDVPFQFGEEARSAFNFLKDAFSSAPILTHWVPNRPIIVETDASDYALAAILSIELESGEIHPVGFHSRKFNPTELNYDVHDKELFAIFEAFRIWRHYLEGSADPVDVVTDHKNLEYFATTKLLNRRQARWSEYLSQFNLIIRFRPSKLSTKPDSLTRRWDVYPKEGGSDYAAVNPHNFRPVFTNQQLSASLRASALYSVSLRGATIINSEQLHQDIRNAYATDPTAASHLPTPSAPNWSLTEDGTLLLHDRIYVPDQDDLRLRVLRNKHDHPLSGHLGRNKTLELIRREYAWPNMRTFVIDYCKSCITCGRAKPRRHKPYGLLKQLPVPEFPWHSISMDLIEHLPSSAGHDAILVIVDRLTKQGIFIPTYDTLTAAQLADLFVMYVFSKHGVPFNVTSDRGSEFVSHFFRGLGKALDMKLHFTSGYHPEGDGQTERSTRRSSNTSVATATTSKTTGPPSSR